MLRCRLTPFNPVRLAGLNLNFSRSAGLNPNFSTSRLGVRKVSNPSPRRRALSSSTIPSQDDGNHANSAKKQSIWSDYSKLAKLRLSGLVMFTSGGGYVLSGGSIMDVSVLAGLCVGTMMCAASAGTFNQIIERKHDALMSRTSNRPMVNGRIDLTTAKAFGVGMGMGGVLLLGATTSLTTAALGGFNILLYTVVYTPLKRVTRFNTEIGALVGAIPPVMGWTAAFGSQGIASPEAFLLAGTLFSWQMHHFMTIAWKNKDQYARAGYVMQSLGDDDGHSTATKGYAWAWSMLALPPIACVLGITTPHFLITGTAVNMANLYRYEQFYKGRTPQLAFSAMKMGFFQLIALFALLAFHIQDRENIKDFQHIRELPIVMLLKENKDDICMWIFGKNEVDEMEAITKVEGQQTITSEGA